MQERQLLFPRWSLVRSSYATNEKSSHREFTPGGFRNTKGRSTMTRLVKYLTGAAVACAMAMPLATAASAQPYYPAPAYAYGDYAYVPGPGIAPYGFGPAYAAVPYEATYGYGPVCMQSPASTTFRPCYQ